jgi:hypothetical protein
VLNTFSTACSQEMRPMLVRMVRQIRQLKSEVTTQAQADSITVIEQTCARMEEFFEDLSSLARDGQLQSVVANPLAAPAKPAARAAKTPEPDQPPAASSRDGSGRVRPRRLFGKG